MRRRKQGNTIIYINIISKLVLAFLLKKKKEKPILNRCTLSSLTYFSPEPPGADVARTSQGITHSQRIPPTCLISY